MLTNVFKDVPVDEGTKIIQEHEIRIGHLSALIQQWVWEGIVAESVIFHAKEVFDLSDEELFEMVKVNYTVGADQRYTVKRAADGYTFVNFNFKDLILE